MGDSSLGLYSAPVDSNPGPIFSEKSYPCRGETSLEIAAAFLVPAIWPRLIRHGLTLPSSPHGTFNCQSESLSMGYQFRQALSLVDRPVRFGHEFAKGDRTPRVKSSRTDAER